jgi:hypothetical protein
MDVVIHAANANGVAAYDLRQIGVIVAVLLRPDRSRELADAGIPIGDPDAGAQGQLFFTGAVSVKLSALRKSSPAGWSNRLNDVCVYP